MRTINRRWFVLSAITLASVMGLGGKDAEAQGIWGPNLDISIYSPSQGDPETTYDGIYAWGLCSPLVETVRLQYGYFDQDGVFQQLASVWPTQMGTDPNTGAPMWYTNGVAVYAVDGGISSYIIIVTAFDQNGDTLDFATVGVKVTTPP